MPFKILESWQLYEEASIKLSGVTTMYPVIFFSKRDQFYDFLFASLNGETIPK